MRLEVNPNFRPAEDQKTLVQGTSPFCPATELHFQEALKKCNTGEIRDVSVIGFFEGEEEVFAVWFSVKSLVYKAVNSQAEESTALVSDQDSPFRGFLVWGPFMVSDKSVYFLGRPLDPKRAALCNLERFLPPADSIEVVRTPVAEGLRYQQETMIRFNQLPLQWSDSEHSWRVALLDIMEELTQKEFSYLRDVKACLLPTPPCPQPSAARQLSHS